jgi:hypothetical protein
MPNKFPSDIVPRNTERVELINNTVRESYGLFEQFEGQLSKEDREYLNSSRGIL